MDPDNQPIPPAKPKSKKVFVWLGFIAVIVVAGLLGYLYFIERGNSQTLRDEIQLMASNAKASDNVSSPAIAPAQAKYSAAVGKFTLTLPSEYYIIVDLDGGFEGGPVTRLNVGTLSTKAEQTIISPDYSRISIAAYPLGGDSYEERKTAAIEQTGVTQQTKVSNVKVDGVEAEAYEFGGLFTQREHYFTKNDIFYVITAGNVDTETSPVQKDLVAVLKGFKFN